MRKLIPIYVRIPLILFMAAFAIECVVDSGNKPAFMVYPAVWFFLGVLLLVLIAAEIVLEASENIAYNMMTEEERKVQDQKKTVSTSFTESVFYKKITAALVRSKSIEEENEVMLDHDYDGIKELDNVLPPWWVYLFYGCIFFGIGYLAYYHVFGGENQIQEYERKNAEALAAVEEWKKTAPDLVDASSVVLLTDEASLNAGKAIFLEKCVACHLADGGGSIGPNLADEYWILGGGIKNVFHTISEGGREGKGMIAWKSEIKPLQIQQIASYVLSLQGTTPANPKAPEGDIWKDEPEGEVATEATETTAP